MLYAIRIWKKVFRVFEEFYEFTSTPFSRGIPVPALYRDSDRDEQINRLKYAAKRQLFAVIYHYLVRNV